MAEKPTKPPVTATTHELPFDKLDPRAFERLCLWLVEAEGYTRAQHLGAAGSDQGRDIVARRGDKSIAFQCKRVKSFGASDAIREIERVRQLPDGDQPDEYVFLVTCDVGAKARQQAQREWGGVETCSFWTGTELDKRVKRHPRIVAEFFDPHPSASDLWDELQEVLGDYNKRLEQDARYQASWFEEPMLASESHSRHGTLALTTLRSWLQGSTQFCLLLGDYGSGKTFLSRILVSELLRLRSDGEALPLPIYVDLALIPRPGVSLSAVNILSDLLASLGCRSSHTHRLLKELRAGRVLVLFDGLDERAIHLERHERTSLLSALRQLAQDKAKVLVTCRTHFFEHRIAEQHAIAGDQPLEGRRTGVPEAVAGTTLFLLPFNQDQIERALNRLHPIRADGILALLGRVYDLRDLASRPVLLHLIGDCLGPLQRADIEGRPINAAALYDTFAHQWIQRDSDKHTLTPSEKLREMTALAERLWQRAGATENPTIDWQELPAWLQGRLGLSLSDRDLVARDLRTAAFLTRDSQGAYRFAHRSWLEYFLATGIARGLREDNVESLDLPPLSPAACVFVVQLLVGDSSAARRTCENILDGPYRTQASENAARLYVAWSRAAPDTSPTPVRINLQDAQLAGDDLAGVAWRRANLVGAVLFGASLTGADLSDADLSYADLRTCRANNAILSRARLRRTRLDGAIFESADLGNADLSESTAAGVDMMAANLAGARLDNARLTAARLVGAQGLECQPSTSTDRAIGIELPSSSRSEMVTGPLLGHEALVESVSFTPCAEFFVSASDDESLLVWDTAAGRPLRRLVGHHDDANSAAVGSRGSLVVSGGNDATVRLWDWQTGRLLRVLKGHKGTVRCVSFSPDEVVVASASEDGTVRVWATESGRLVHHLTGHNGAVECVAISPRSDYVASGGYGVQVWELDSGNRLWSLPKEDEAWVYLIAFSRDGSQLLTAAPGKLCVRDALTGKLLRTHSERHVEAFTPDRRRYLAYDASGVARLYGTENSTAEQHYEGFSTFAPGKLRPLTGSVCFSSDESMLAAGSSRSVGLWDVRDGRQLRLLTGHLRGRYQDTREDSHDPLPIAIAPDGRWLATTTHDNRLLVWDLAEGSLLASIPACDQTIHDLAFSEDGKTLFSASFGEVPGGLKSKIRAWDTETAKAIASQECEGGARRIVASPDGKWLVSGGHGDVQIWDCTSWTLVHSIETGGGWVNGLAFSGDRKSVLVTKSDGSLLAAELASGHTREVLSGTRGTGKMLGELSSDGCLAAFETESGQICIRDIASGHDVRDIADSFYISTAAFSANGQLIACVEYNSAVAVWSLASGSEILRHRHCLARSVCFSPNSRLVVSCAADHSVRIRDVHTGQLEMVLGTISDGWYCSRRGLPPRGDEQGLRAISYSGQDNRVWSGYELNAARSLGQEFDIRLCEA